MASNQHNSVRIIAGAKRGSRIRFDGAPGLRPTGDRVREMVFAWLQTSTQGCSCLDMFAGSGALGFEASSRGAERVVMLETNKRSCTLLHQNIDRLGFDNVSVLAADALAEATYQKLPDKDSRFDLIFIDPPFDDCLHQSAIDLVHRFALAKPDAFVYIELAKLDSELEIPANWELRRDKIAGEVRLMLYRVLQLND